MTSASESRVTRSRRSLRRALLLCAAGIAAAGALRAQEPRPTGESARDAEAAAPDGTPPSAGPAAKPRSPPAAAGAEPPVAPPDDADAPPARASSPGRFEPTEKVRADFDVSFPIDI
jgi:hypothetical protein